MARLISAAAGGFLLAAFLSVTFVMRGPVTAVGPLAHEICEAMQVGWDAYGTLSALPIAAFGVFSFAAPALVRRFGLWGGIAAAIAVLFAGAVLRMMTNWSVLLAATLLVGAGIAILNVLMPVVVKTVWAQKSGPMMGLYTGVIGSSGAVGGFRGRLQSPSASGRWRPASRFFAGVSPGGSRALRRWRRPVLLAMKIRNPLSAPCFPIRLPGRSRR